MTTPLGKIISLAINPKTPLPHRINSLLTLTETVYTSLRLQEATFTHVKFSLSKSPVVPLPNDVIASVVSQIQQAPGHLFTALSQIFKVQYVEKTGVVLACVVFFFYATLHFKERNELRCYRGDLFIPSLCLLRNDHPPQSSTTLKRSFAWLLIWVLPLLLRDPVLQKAASFCLGVCVCCLTNLRFEEMREKCLIKMHRLDEIEKQEILIMTCIPFGGGYNDSSSLIHQWLYWYPFPCNHDAPSPFVEWVQTTVDDIVAAPSADVGLLVLTLKAYQTVGVSHLQRDDMYKLIVSSFCLK